MRNVGAGADAKLAKSVKTDLHISRKIPLYKIIEIIWGEDDMQNDSK